MAIAIGEFLDTSRIENLNEVHMPRRLSTENYPYIRIGRFRYHIFLWPWLRIKNHQRGIHSFPIRLPPPTLWIQPIPPHQRLLSEVQFEWLTKSMGFP